MPLADPGASQVRPADVERWIAALGLETVGRAERDGIVSWDLVLDGRRRFDLRVTVILDPGLAVVVWAHYAPPINDMFRKSYRKLLRWNDEFPLVKFSLSEDEAVILAAELSVPGLDAEGFGIGLARIVGVADRLLDESVDWLWLGGRRPDQSARTTRNADFLARFEGRFPELFGP